MHAKIVFKKIYACFICLMYYLFLINDGWDVYKKQETTKSNE